MQISFTKEEVRTNLNAVIALTGDLDFVKGSKKASLENDARALKDDFEQWVKDLSDRVATNESKALSVKYYASRDGGGMIIEVDPDYTVKINEIISENAPLLSSVLTGLYGLALAFKSVAKTYEYVLKKLVKEIDQIDVK